MSWIMKAKIYDCARKLGLSQSNINRCLKNRRKTLGGYTFEYAE